MKRRAIAASIILAPLAALGAIKSEPVPELRPPREELPAPVLEKGNQAWVLAGIGAAIVLAVWFRPRKKPAPAPPDPFTIAQRELGALRADMAKGSAAEISAILRRYAVEAFELKGSALTAEEVVSGLALRRSCPADVANAAWRFLSECDVFKFAPGAPAVELSGLIGRGEKLLTDLEAARAAAARTL